MRENWLPGHILCIIWESRDESLCDTLHAYIYEFVNNMHRERKKERERDRVKNYCKIVASDKQ